MTFENLIDLGLEKFKEKIEEVSKKAEKQYNIEKKLNETVDKFKELHLEVINYKDTGSSVLKNVEEI